MLTDLFLIDVSTLCTIIDIYTEFNTLHTYMYTYIMHQNTEYNKIDKPIE